jgi:hypothetical protein
VAHASYNVTGRLEISKLVAVATATWCGLCANGAIADDRGWEFQPYRIQAVLAIDAPGGMAEQLSHELPRYLHERVVAAIGPTWDFQLQLVTGSLRHTLLSGIAALEGAPSAEFPSEGDKLLVLSVRGTPYGYELTAREFDRTVERWGIPIERRSGQSEMIPEQLFALVWQTVAPVAQLELDPEDSNRVTLIPRGNKLWRSTSNAPWVNPGDLFLPVLRRTTRGGELAKDGIQVVPWTYIESAEVDEGKVVGRIHSGNRNPLGARRRGRVEQLAIALRSEPGDTRLHLVSRTNPDKSLAGYEVYAQDAADKSTTLIGSTDDAGSILISAGPSPVKMLVIKHGGLLLARLPVVPGADREVTVPLPDDDVRLAAEARLAALREELVDVVVRRNILMARARQKIKDSDFPAAQTLLRAIDDLPGRSQFNLTLNTAARLLRSDDPQIQRRIDQLFQATQTVLTQYLDTRPISELNEELRQAQRNPE